MHYRGLVFVTLLSSIGGFGCAPSAGPPVGYSGAMGLAAIEAAQIIDAQRLRQTVAVLAGDEFEGRGPASVGDLKTQRYLSTALDRLGYSPGGVDGGWLQTFDIVSVTATPPATWNFESAGNALALSLWDDFIVASGVQEPNAVIDEAEVVFVGYGIRAPEYDWDDYKGLDVSGKVLLMLNNDPDWDRELFEGNRRLYYGRWTYKYEIAAQMGAAAAIIIHTTASAGYPFQVVQTSWSGPQFKLPAGGEPAIAVEAWVTEEAARRLVALAGQDLAQLIERARRSDFAPIPLGVTTSLRLENDLSRVRTANVAGLLEGRDPVLKNEVVVFTAHHDHLGVGEPDDAGDVTYIGYGKSSLDTVVEHAVALQGRTVQGDQFPDRGFFYRSDQFSFAKIGVPAIYLDDGTDFIGQPEGWGVAQIENWEAVHYHQPSDELDDSWTFDGMIEDAQLAFYIGLAIAEEDAMPTWNAGDEFEAARLAALADL